MVTYNRYDTLADLDRRRRKAVDSMLFEGEEFVLAIDCKEGRIRSKTNTKLVLTNTRVIAVKKGLIGKRSEDYSLSDISSVQYDTSLLSGSLKLQGSGIDDEYPTTKRLGQAFSNAVRKQMQSTSN